MKVKFTTYMELDLQGMSAAELNDLANKATEVLDKKRKANDPLVQDVIKHPSTIKQIAKLVMAAYHIQDVTISVLAENYHFSVYFTPTSRARINNMLIEYGYDKLK